MRLRLPVILVVGLRLGCINHALLSVVGIKASGLPLAGWVANRLQPEMAVEEENIATLEKLIDAPLLGVTPHLDAFDVETLGNALDIGAIAQAATDR